MLTSSQVEALISTLLDARQKMLWLTNQVPVNEEQKNCVEGAKKLLEKVNQYLIDFGVKLPN